MSDHASTINRKAAEILTALEAQEHALIKSSETDTDTGKHPRLYIEVAIKPGDADE